MVFDKALVLFLYILHHFSIFFNSFELETVKQTEKA